MSDAGAQSEMQGLLEAFRASLDATWRLDRDRALSAEVGREARPVAIALSARGEGDGRLEQREAVALTSLLGRRVGALGLTPTAMLAVVPTLLGCLDLPPRADLESVFVEGYVAAREEQLAEKHAIALAAGIVDVELLPRLWAVFVGGAQEGGAMEAVFEALGRRMLEHDAAALLVHVGRLEAPSPDTAAQVFTLDATCRMLGVRCVFAGVDLALEAAATERGLDLSLVERERSPRLAFELAVEASGLSVREQRGFGRALRRFVGGG